MAGGEGERKEQKWQIFDGCGLCESKGEERGGCRASVQALHGSS